MKVHVIPEIKEIEVSDNVKNIDIPSFDGGMNRLVIKTFINRIGTRYKIAATQQFLDLMGAD